MPDPIHNPTCFRGHMGTMLLEPGWTQQAITAIRSGVWQANARPVVLRPVAGTTVIDPNGDPDYPEAWYSITDDGIAVIEMTGAMAKSSGKYANVGTVSKRGALRDAVSRQDVRAILLCIDSPGGTVAGTQALGDEVRSVDAIKPVFAHIEDLGASAAYWVASQARRITANASALVGSLGTYTVIYDTSEQAKMEGVKAYLISTGPQKGAFVDGVPVKPEQIAEAQSVVDSLNALFMGAVASGRRKTMDETAKLFTGQVHIASQAKALGLIDGIQSIDQTVAEISGMLAGQAATSAATRRLELARARP